MRVLIFHGYLLRGTGSNIYTTNLAQALAAAGHDVHLCCQDRDADELDWIHRLGTWDDGRLTLTELRDAGDQGRVSVYLPPIGRTLPVYVADSYEGFDARPYPELSDEEVEAYIEANAGALRDVADHAGGIDAVLANHLISGPVIAARAAIAPYAVKVHGSALEYTVRPHRRFVPWATEGLEGASGVLVGSRHTAESLWEVVGDPGLAERTRLGPPGVDVGAFRPAERDQARAALAELADDLEGAATDVAEGDEGEGAQSSFSRDPRRAAAGLREVCDHDGPLVGFVGKLIVSKGIDLLLAAWPLVRAECAEARLVVVGFGGWEDALGALLDALDGADLGAARAVAERGREAEGGPSGRLRLLDDFLAAPPDGYAGAARGIAGSVTLTGRLEHDEVAVLLPALDALVMPSTFPEAFGMVAAEAAAAGALPVSADHSGMREVTRALAEGAPDAADLVGFSLDERPVEAIASRLSGWLARDHRRRIDAGQALREVVVERFGWDAVAQGVLAAAAGRLDELPRVPKR